MGYPLLSSDYYMYNFVSGNPGISDYYMCFMQELHELSGHSLSVSCVSHDGHAHPAGKSNKHDEAGGHFKTVTKRLLTRNLKYASHMK